MEQHEYRLKGTNWLFLYIIIGIITSIIALFIIITFYDENFRYLGIFLLVISLLLVFQYFHSSTSRLNLTSFGLEFSQLGRYKLIEWNEVTSLEIIFNHSTKGVGHSRWYITYFDNSTYGFKMPLISLFSQEEANVVSIFLGKAEIVKEKNKNKFIWKITHNNQ
ncbi:MAG: hypothetical protein INQ03_18780 [Candidatus Heimdallarchaeota archaeon]|nr:hypothetical protein [Candidatus Heimdallarchaeota archaeon]